MKKNKLIMLCVIALLALTAGSINVQAAAEGAANAKKKASTQGKVSAANVFNRLLKKEKQKNAPPPEDGIHDPVNDGTHVLQPPRIAFEGLPTITLGEIKWCREISDAVFSSYEVGVKYYGPDY